MPISDILNFETVKLITVKNWKLGIVYRLLQVLVLVYVGVYALWLNRGYQKTSPIDGVLYLKVKGLAKDQFDGVYDSSDLVVPATENDAIFLTTRARHTIQTNNSVCIDYDPKNSCVNDKACAPHSETSNGYVLPHCNTTASRCQILGWCPVENDAQPLVEYDGIKTWTIFMRSHVTYSYFSMKTNNANRADRGYNIFSVEEMTVGENFTDIENVGAIFSVSIDWTCDLDLGIQSCSPTYKYTRVDSGGTASTGFNYRRAIYYGDTYDDPSMFIFQRRLLSKLFGIRFIFHITGIGKKFDPATTVITIGSGVAFFALATIVTDFILQYLHPGKEIFDNAKRQPVVLDRQDTQESSPLVPSFDSVNNLN